jgi:hypothetical protein
MSLLTLRTGLTIEQINAIKERMHLEQINEAMKGLREVYGAQIGCDVSKIYFNADLTFEAPTSGQGHKYQMYEEIETASGKRLILDDFDE